jgi:hypothetical protein
MKNLVECALSLSILLKRVRRVASEVLGSAIGFVTVASRVDRERFRINYDRSGDGQPD